MVVRRHTRATRIGVDRPLRPGETVTFTAEAGTSFEVRGNSNFVSGSARPATAAELRSLRWRVHCGGRFIANTALQEGPLRVTLPERLFGESILAAAYTWEPQVHIFSHWWIPGRSGTPAGAGTLRNAQQLAQIIRACGKPVPRNVETFYEHLHRGFSAPAMNSTLQQAHFLAQAIHESIGFTELTELIKDEVAAPKYKNSNGNTGTEDGAAFKGRGIMQITGYNGYRSVFRAYMGARYPAFRDAHAERRWLREEAERLADDPGFAVQAGFHFWTSKPVNDRAALDDVLGASIRVNGWVTPALLPNGWEERVRFTQIAKDHLGLRR
jgi:predicted chitinase